MKARAHTQGRGIESIATSVKMSDQACAKYIVVVLIQAPGVGSELQFSEIGKHCSRFAAKNAMVHVMVSPIMSHEMTKNVLVKKILVGVSFAQRPLTEELKHGTFDRRGSRLFL